MKELLEYLNSAVFYVIVNPVDNRLYHRVNKLKNKWATKLEDCTFFTSKTLAISAIATYIKREHVTNPDEYLILVELKSKEDPCLVDIKRDLTKILIKNQKAVIKKLKSRLSHAQYSLDRNPTDAWNQQAYNRCKAQLDSAEIVLANLTLRF